MNMFRQFPDYLVNELKQRPLTFHSHDRGVPLTYFSDPKLKLSTMFNVLTTSVDPQGIEIVTSISHKRLPIYAVMFHAEKAPFDFGEGHNFTHDPAAIELSVELSNFFVFEARRSPLRYDFDELNMKVIQNYSLEYFDDYLGYVYFFDDL